MHVQIFSCGCAWDVVDLSVHHTRTANYDFCTSWPHSILLLHTGAHHQEQEGISWSELRVAAS